MTRRLLMIRDGQIQKIIADYVRQEYGEDLVAIHMLVPITKSGKVLGEPRSIGYPNLPFAFEFSVNRNNRTDKIAKAKGHYDSKSA